MDFRNFVETINEEELDIYYPLFNKTITTIEPRENKYVINSPQLIQQLVINNTSYDICIYSDGNHSIFQIVKLMLENYTVDFDVLKNDVIMTIYHFWRIGLLVFKNGLHPFNKILTDQILVDNKYLNFKVLFKNELTKNLRINDNNVHTSPFVDAKLEYNKVGTLKRNGASLEYFFQLSINDELALIISFKPFIVYKPIPLILSFDISYIRIQNELILEKNYIKEFLTWACKWYINSLSYFVFDRSINIYYFDLPSDNAILTILNNMGFSKMGMLKREIGNNNIIVYSYKVFNE